jgi:RNA polymerase sigma factor (sigma-70 family)
VDVDRFITIHFNDMMDVCQAYLGDTHEADDLLQEAAIRLLNNRNNPKTKEAIQKGHGMYQFCGIVRMMVTRKGDKFNKTYLQRRKVLHFDYVQANDGLPSEDIERLNLVDDIVSELRWYKKELWRLYFDERYSFTKLSEETRIARDTLYRDIKEIKEEVRKKVKDK